MFWGNMKWGRGIKLLPFGLKLRIFGLYGELYTEFGKVNEV